MMREDIYSLPNGEAVGAYFGVLEFISALSKEVI